MKTISIILLVSGVALLILIIVIDIKNKESKLKIVNLVIGILIGACLALGIYFLVDNRVQTLTDIGNMQFERPNGNMGEMNFKNGRGGMQRFEGNTPIKPNETNSNAI